MKNIQDQIENIRTAYLAGATADMVCARIEGVWCSWWTLPPCSPSALERAGQQMTRSKAEAVWHVRRAMLKSKEEQAREVVIATELPERLQQVFAINDGRVIQTSRLLLDEGLIALQNAFLPRR